MKIQQMTTCDADHVEIFVKDMSLARFISSFPGFSGLAGEMRKRLPDGYKFYLVDFIVQDCEPGMKTCRDTRWHVDGDFNSDNRYVLWARGPNRTEFPEVMPEITEMPADRNQQSVFLEKMSLKGVEVNDQTIVAYDSRTPHRGVVCKNSGRRTFLRMMATNYILPKNIRRSSLNGA